MVIRVGDVLTVGTIGAASVGRDVRFTSCRNWSNHSVESEIMCRETLSVGAGRHYEVLQ